MAQNAVNLNISLMKWRIVPELDIQEISKLKCLLIGAGTLGCQLSRNLLGWGIQEINLIDNGRISYSNPVRQSLYTFMDSKLNRLKAETASERLKEIHPNIKSKGYQLNITMPGHFNRYKDKEEIVKEVEELETILKQHDVIFLVTDNRESRWLPTLLGQVHKKIVITVALGYDSYVIIRHGLNNDNDNNCNERSGCYFCNDVVAPTDSVSNRTLDQQCTVTRPGVSYIASGLAAEMLVSLVSHPLKVHAPPMNIQNTYHHHNQIGYLGFVPQYIRGNLYDYSLQILNNKNYNHCVACSNSIIQQYSDNKHQFIPDIIQNPDRLQDYSGITSQITQIDYEKDFIAID